MSSIMRTLISGFKLMTCLPPYRFPSSPFKVNYRKKKGLSNLFLSGSLSSFFNFLYFFKADKKDSGRSLFLGLKIFI